MKLYYMPHACSLSVHILLRELKSNAELIQVDPDTKITSQGENYLEINPNGYVPALDISAETGIERNAEGPIIITEVPAILQYLAEVNTGDLFSPVDSPLQRAQQSSMMNFLASELHKAFVPYWYEKNLSEQARKQAFVKLDKRITYLSQCLSDGRNYLLNNQYGIADIYAFVLIRWCDFHQIDFKQWSHIAEFMQRIQQRPAVQAAITAESE